MGKAQKYPNCKLAFFTPYPFRSRENRFLYAGVPTPLIIIIDTQVVDAISELKLVDSYTFTVSLGNCVVWNDVVAQCVAP